MSRKLSNRMESAVVGRISVFVSVLHKSASSPRPSPPKEREYLRRKSGFPSLLLGGSGAGRGGHFPIKVLRCSSVGAEASIAFSARCDFVTLVVGQIRNLP